MLLGSAFLTLYFSNDTIKPYNVPGWFAFSIYRIRLEINTNDSLMHEKFGDATDSEFATLQNAVNTSPRQSFMITTRLSSMV